MTLIVYIKCSDASILLLDRKESNTSDVGQYTKKYYLPTNQEFVLALAGESPRIDTIVTDLNIDPSVTRDTIRQKLHDIVKSSQQLANLGDTASGLLLIRNNNSFQFNNVWFTNSQKSIVGEDPAFKCYGEGAVLADYLIRKFDLPSFSFEKACKYLLAILQDISKRMDSVGSIDDYGADLLVFTNSGELKQTTIHKSDGINEINCNCNIATDYSVSFSPSKTNTKLEKIKTVPKQVTKSIQANDQNYSIKYQINGGKINSIQSREDVNSLLISLIATSDGELTIILPRTLIDSKVDRYDDKFFVSCDGIQVDFYETPTQIDRKLIISFEKDCEKIEIVGTLLYGKLAGTESLDDFKSEYHIYKKLPIIVQTDKSIYSYGSDMIITISNPYFIHDKEITLKITDEDGKTVYKNLIPVSKEAKGTYQDSVSIKGKDWSKPDSRYKIKAECSDMNAELEITVSDFDVVIKLDQKVYSWRDKVLITVVAPDLIKDPNLVEEIGQTDDLTVIISTSQGQLNNYKLVETVKDTGIFVGEIQLSGFLNHNMSLDRSEITSFGETIGSGPNDGKISCLGEDDITIGLIIPTKIISASALIRWNIGEISWMESSLSATGDGVIRVVDPDMNLDPQKIEQFEIRVWSDTDAAGIKLPVTETGKSTGIFKGIIKFTIEDFSKSPILRVSEGDTITAEYVDETLPDPYSLNSNLVISATTMMGTASTPLEQIKLLNPRILDQFGNLLTRIKSEQDIMISADLINLQENSQKFVFIVKIDDDFGAQVSLTWINCELIKGQTISPTLAWKPTTFGKYTATIFVWSSINNPTALSPPLALDLVVNNEFGQKKSITNIQNEEIQQRFPIKHIVSIPFGTNVSGCEKYHKCFIPHKMIVRVNQVVIWNNDDVAAHTITSGTIDGVSSDDFDSGLIKSGSSFAFKFIKKGTYPYFCLVHPWQDGIIVVE